MRNNRNSMGYLNWKQNSIPPLWRQSIWTIPTSYANNIHHIYPYTPYYPLIRQDTLIQTDPREREIPILNKDYNEFQRGKCVKFETQQGQCFKWWDVFQGKYVTKCNDTPIKSEYGCRKRRIRNFNVRVRLLVPLGQLSMLQNPTINSCLYSTDILNRAGQTFDKMVSGMSVITSERIDQALNAAQGVYKDQVGACLKNQYSSFWNSLEISAQSTWNIVRDWHEVTS
ncbi:hypothetical protein [Priestia megaterium]|uniref:hypothetical protein n=1 Tax=Priestia megaterium TaxID=1404 RepID=UPI000472A096|nr:hypothetical protein [Priestia megaterium]